jgi:hypothetical protein
VHRRQFLAGLGTGSLLAAAGCSGDPDRPGGTLVVENRYDRAVSVTVTATGRSARFERSVDAGGTAVDPAFVAADPGEVVTLAARIGDEATPAPATFEFLPGGGDGTPPELARLTVQNPVEAAATWTASPAD